MLLCPSARREPISPSHFLLLVVNSPNAALQVLAESLESLWLLFAALACVGLMLGLSTWGYLEYAALVTSGSILGSPQGVPLVHGWGDESA